MNDFLSIRACNAMEEVLSSLVVFWMSIRIRQLSVARRLDRAYSLCYPNSDRIDIKPCPRNNI